MSKNATIPILLLGLIAFFSACSTGYQAGGVRNPSRVKSADKEVVRSSKLRTDMVQYAKKYVGVPYRYAGKTPRGFDCSGFTSYVYQKFDIALSAGSKQQARQGKKIAIRAVEPGDLLFFGKGGKMTHVALVTRNTRAGIEVIHSTSSKGIMVQNVSESSYWRPRMLFARRILD